MQIQKALLSQTRHEQSHGTLGKSRKDKETIMLNQEERVTKAGLNGNQLMLNQEKYW